MRYGLIISAVLHAAVVLLAVLGVLPSPSPVIVTAEPIPVDIVDIGELTNTRVEEKAPAPPKPVSAAPRAPEKPPPPPPPAVEARQDAPPPAPPQVPEPPARVAEAAPPRQPEPPPPLPKPPEPKPEPAKPEPKKPEPPKPEPKKPEPPKPEPKKPEPRKPEPEKPDFQQMLKDLTREPARPEPQDRRTAEADSPSRDEAPRLSDRLTVSQMDALRRQMSACWLVDPGLPNVREVSVEIRVRIARDRTVESAEIVDAARMRSDRTYRSVAESALRAVRNPRCNPLELPPDKYEVWRDAVFVFSPRDVL